MPDYSTPAGDPPSVTLAATDKFSLFQASGYRVAALLSQLATFIANSAMVNLTITGLYVSSASNALTARAGGGQALGTPLTASINRFTTVGTAADSALLPVCIAGAEITVINDAAANSMNVFPATGETINALSANTAFAVPAGKTVTLYSAVATKWHAILSA